MAEEMKAVELYQSEPEWVKLRPYMVKKLVLWLSLNGDLPKALAVIAQAWQTEEGPTSMEEARLIHNMILADGAVDGEF
jgi:hypothetical protein